MIIRTVEEARAAVANGDIQPNSPVIIDPFPPADQEDQLVTEEMLALDREIFAVVSEAVKPRDMSALDPIRGMTADQISNEYNKAAMLDMIEAVTGTRPPTRTTAADLADQLETLAV